MSSFLVIDLVLLTLVVITAVAVVEARSLFQSILLFAIYGLLLSLVWANMDALDVAFTEAAVGAGILLLLLVGTVALVGEREVVRRAVHWPGLLIVLFTGAALVYGTLDMPAFGDPDAPVHNHPIEARFTAQDLEKVSADAESTGENYFHGHVPNQVTTVIVSYRALDTLFEVAVIFAAGLGMILLLRGRADERPKGGPA